MLNFPDFFTACAGLWKTERIYHSVLEGEVERSYTEFRAETLGFVEKQQMLSNSSSNPSAFADDIAIDIDQALADPLTMPGFAVSFETRSEKGEEVSMSLKALFVPSAYVIEKSSSTTAKTTMPFPPAAQVSESEELIQGLYLRDQGYSEAGAIAGRFTYLPTRQTLEMTTYYSRSIAVDQMRFVDPTLRLRTIVTYQRGDSSAPPVINLIGFGVERKYPL